MAILLFKLNVEKNLSKEQAELKARHEKVDETKTEDAVTENTTAEETTDESNKAEN